MRQTGSRTEQLAAARARYIPRGLASSMGGFSHRAEGSTVFDVDGREYIDFAAGISVLNVGHRHPRVQAAIAAQLELLVHPAAQVMMPEVYVELAQRLCEVAPGSHDKKALVVNTGVEAIENAVKIARSHTGRPALVSFHNSFHGRTLMGMSLTGRAEPYKQGFGPFAPEVYQVPYPYPYRWPGGSEACSDQALDGLVELFRTTVPAEQVAAVVIEPVQGEGGFVVPPADFLPRLLDLCHENGILLVADEVQTGLGRTGKMWAVEHTGVVPDLITIAKSLGGGMPIGAVVGTAEVMDAPGPGGLGGTYAGNALACAAALAVLDVVAEENLSARAMVIGETVRGRLELWAAEMESIGEVRGLGAMIAIELVTSRATRSPAKALTADVLHRAHAAGLILLKAGLQDNVIRLLMPLTIDEATLARGLQVLEAALRGAVADAAPA